MTKREMHESALSREYSNILKWENDVGIFDYIVDDVPLWRLLRNNAIVNHTVSKGIEQAHSNEKPSLLGLMAISMGALRSAAQLAKLSKADLLFWGFPRRQHGDDGWVDPLTDPIINCLHDFHSISFERPLQGKHLQPEVTKSLIWYDAPKVLARLRSRIPASLSANDQRVISDLAQLISDKFDLTTPEIERNLKRELIAFRTEKAAASFVLSRTKPKAVFVVNRWINSGVIAACSRYSIPSYEFQHGAVGNEGFKCHTPYSKAIDPDRFLVFGKEWKNYEWGVPFSCVHNVGAPYIWNQRSNRARATCGSKIMLVSQPNLSKPLSVAFEEICRALPEHSFLLKLHPQDRGNANQRYPLSDLPNVEIATSRKPLYQSFLECQAAIGQDSTALLEASFFNLKVGLLKLPNTLKNDVRSRIGSFNFFDAQNIELVKEMLASKRRDEAEDGNGYFDAFREKKLRDLLATP